MISNTLATSATRRAVKGRNRSKRWVVGRGLAHGASLPQGESMAPSRPPGPRSHPLWGHFGPFRSDALGFLVNCAAEFGDMASFRLGHRRLVLVSHPELIEQVLVTDNRNFTK